MANVHGGNLHHIYADTEILSARAWLDIVRPLYLVYFVIWIELEVFDVVF